MLLKRFAAIAVMSVASTSFGARDGSVDAGANALLAIDQHRSTVIDRIVTQWGGELAQSNAGVSPEQLRTMLGGLRADILLAASLAGTIAGLRNVLATSIARTPAGNALMRAKALGDFADDVIYTPVTPCRLLETRGTFAAVYQGGGAFTPNELRNYTVEAGNGVCVSQLPAGLNPSALQLQVFGIPISSASNGDVEILPAGSTFGNTATLVYLGNSLFTSASTTAKVNPTNNRIGVQVRGGGAHVAIDVVGYFKRPGNYGGTHAITGQYATDSGGVSNTTSGDYGTVGGGGFNSASGDSSTVGGGAQNVASGTYGTVGGGRVNFASGGFGFVGGGEGNVASGDSSTVGGGGSNTASGRFSTVVGGALNLAGGNFSAAAGFRAKAYVDGSFVFSDSTDADFSSGLPNEFLVGATGGIGMYTARNYTTGCHINAGGGSWACSSSRDVKRDFTDVDTEEVLRKAVSLPLMSWRYMNEAEAIRHVGPMAQDFRAAFGLGEDDKHISAVDAEGIALAAIQGLHKHVEEKDALIAAQSGKISALERAVVELRRAVDALTAQR